MERTEQRVFIPPIDPRLARVLNSRPPTQKQVRTSLERDARPLVDRFAKQLERERGLRDDVLVRR